MARIFLILSIAIVLAGCQTLMHPTIAEQVLCAERNTNYLLQNYQIVLITGKKPVGLDVTHEIALAKATQALMEDLQKSAKMSLKKDR